MPSNVTVGLDLSETNAHYRANECPWPRLALPFPRAGESRSSANDYHRTQRCLSPSPGRQLDALVTRQANAPCADRSDPCAGTGPTGHPGRLEELTSEFSFRPYVRVCLTTGASATSDKLRARTISPPVLGFDDADAMTNPVALGYSSSGSVSCRRIGRKSRP